MEITTDKYSVQYDPTAQVIICQGALRLAGMQDYAPIVHLLDQAIEDQPPVLTLNLRQLNFLNSSGINVFSKFVLKVRNQQDIHLIVQGSTEIPWQGISLANLKRLMPQLELTWE